MRKAILKRFFGIITIALLLCAGIASIFMNRAMLEQTKTDMLYTLNLLDDSINVGADLQNRIDYLNDITMTNVTRITILGIDGTVWADTDAEASSMENHENRVEVKEAVEKGQGSSVRYSKTMRKNMLYTCIYSEKGNYLIRLCIPFNGMMEYIGILFPSIMISVLVSFLISLLIAGRFSKSITTPLEEITKEFSKLDQEKPDFHEYRYDELNCIAVAADKLYARIDAAVRGLKFEKKKIDYILENMEGGLILLDDNQDIISINRSAREILSCYVKGEKKNIVYYTKNTDLLNALDRVQQEDREEVFDMGAKDGKIYCVHVSKVRAGVLSEQMPGLIILFVDVTSDRQNQQMRQEFFSNASHELKTPITSISGYAELLNAGLPLDDEHQKLFVEKIKAEAKNMSMLINDILDISRIEMKALTPKLEKVAVKEIVEDCIKSFGPMAKERNISITSDCQNVTLMIDKKHIMQIMNNLVSNAVKYNKDSGRVDITVKNTHLGTLISVSDTGIGIPEEDIPRIFERFYRVDKGRSRKMGGTGLGLSIVRHIVQFYGGSVKVESQVGQGTVVTVIL